jgi:hypothetical protein
MLVGTSVAIRENYETWSNAGRSSGESHGAP